MPGPALSGRLIREQKDVAYAVWSEKWTLGLSRLIRRGWEKATRYNIRGLPTVLVFKGGNVVEQRLGLIGEADLRRMLDSHL